MHNKNEIKTFEELYEKILIDGNIYSAFQRGHLMIEFQYVKILKITANKFSTVKPRLSHFKLVNALYDLSYISKDQMNVLLEINNIRNKFAHDITFHPTPAEIGLLFKKSQNVFYEFFEGFSRGVTKMEKIEYISICEVEMWIDYFMEILYNLKILYDAIEEGFWVLGQRSTVKLSE